MYSKFQLKDDEKNFFFKVGFLNSFYKGEINTVFEMVVLFCTFFCVSELKELSFLSEEKRIFC